MKKHKIRDIVIIISLLLLIVVIIPWAHLFLFLGKDALQFIGYVSLMVIACFVFLPVCALGSLARSGAPVPIGRFFADAFVAVKTGIARYSRKEKKKRY